MTILIKKHLQSSKHVNFILFYCHDFFYHAERYQYIVFVKSNYCLLSTFLFKWKFKIIILMLLNLKNGPNIQWWKWLTSLVRKAIFWQPISIFKVPPDCFRPFWPISKKFWTFFTTPVYFGLNLRHDEWFKRQISTLLTVFQILKRPFNN